MLRRSPALGLSTDPENLLPVSPPIPSASQWTQAANLTSNFSSASLQYPNLSHQENWVLKQHRFMLFSCILNFPVFTQVQRSVSVTKEHQQILLNFLKSCLVMGVRELLHQ